MEAQALEGRIDPRIRRTRGYIQDAFRALLSEKGFKSITVREVTERADVNRATFYAHYADKFELLNLTLQEIFKEELEGRALNVCQYTEENLRALMITVCEFIQESNSNCKSVDSQFELIIERQVRRQIQELLAHWLVQSGAEGDVVTRAVATSWTIYGLAEQWNQKDRQEDVESYTDRVLPLIKGNMAG